MPRNMFKRQKPLDLRHSCFIDDRTPMRSSCSTSRIALTTSLTCDEGGAGGGREAQRRLQDLDREADRRRRGGPGAQDLDAPRRWNNGRPLELEALVGSVVELGRITGVATPAIDAIYAVTGLLARTLEARGAGLALPG